MSGNHLGKLYENSIISSIFFDFNFCPDRSLAGIRASRSDQNICKMNGRIALFSQFRWIDCIKTSKSKSFYFWSVPESWIPFQDLTVFRSKKGWYLGIVTLATQIIARVDRNHLNWDEKNVRRDKCFVLSGRKIIRLTGRNCTNRSDAQTACYKRREVSRKVATIGTKDAALVWYFFFENIHKSRYKWIFKFRSVL